MSKQVVVDIFSEDRGHEEFLKPIVRRLADEEGISVSIRVRSARGGHARAIQEFKLYQSLLEAAGEVVPDVIVVAIDGNCARFTEKRQEISGATERHAERVIAACPDPHVERWYMADLDAFHAVVGHRPALGRKKCQRHLYKRQLATAVRDAGHPVTLGGLEFASELVDAMDLYRAGKNDSSLRAFVDELRGHLRRAREA